MCDIVNKYSLKLNVFLQRHRHMVSIKSRIQGGGQSNPSTDMSDVVVMFGCCGQATHTFSVCVALFCPCFVEFFR